MNHFNLKAFQKGYQPIDKDFLILFIGFAEGDGSWIIRKSKKGIIFKIGQKDCQALTLIRNTLGFGRVATYKAKTRVNKLDRTYFDYVVEKKQDVFFLILLFNGNLILDKTRKKFQLWIQSYTFFYDKKIIFNTNKPQINLDSSWLCGFTDAEGCFFSRLTNSTTRRNTEIQRKFSLVQTEKNILVLIRNCILKQTNSPLNKPLYLITENRTYTVPTFQVTFVDRRHLLVLVDYFERYALKTTKKGQFNRWKSFVIQKDLVSYYKSQNALNLLKQLTLAVQDLELPFDPLDLAIKKKQGL